MTNQLVQDVNADEEVELRRSEGWGPGLAGAQLEGAGAGVAARMSWANERCTRVSNVHRAAFVPADDEPSPESVDSEPHGASLKGQPLLADEVARFFAHNPNAYNSNVVRALNTAYDALMAQQPPQPPPGQQDPAAVFIGKALTEAITSLGAALLGADTSSLSDEQKASLIGDIVQGCEKATVAALAKSSVSRRPTPAAAAAPPTPSDPYELLATSSCGMPGLCPRAIDRVRRYDARRKGKWALRLMAGARGGDEGKEAHEAVAALIAAEAAREGITVDELREMMVAHLGNSYAVIGKDGLLNGSGAPRGPSRSFIWRIEHSAQHGAQLLRMGTEEEEARKTGPVGDEFTWEQVEGLLEDPRVCPELKKLLRLSTALMVESELAEAEVILNRREEAAIEAKVMGSSGPPVPLRPRYSKRGMAGGQGVATFAGSESHRLQWGYLYVVYAVPGFDFPTCGCALWTAPWWPIIPTSNQSGGDNGVLLSDRYGNIRGRAGLAARMPPSAMPSDMAPPPPPAPRGGHNFKPENTVVDLMAKCTTCNNEKLIHAQRCIVGGTYEYVQVTFGINKHLKSCSNRIKLSSKLPVPPRGVTKFVSKRQLSITRVEPPTP